MMQRVIAAIFKYTSNKSTKDPAFAVVVGIGVIFLIATVILSWGLSSVVHSPDEMVNREFAWQFAENFSLKIPAGEYANQFGTAPRSVSLEFGAYLPAVFYGLPVLYGAIASVFGNGIVWVLTPLFAFFAGLAFFVLLRKVWGERVAMISGMLYFLHPVVWFYTVRGLYNNILFLSLFILALWAVIARPIKMSWINDVLAFVFVGLALFVRSSEVLWVGAVFLLMWLLMRGWKNKSFTLRWIGLGVVGSAIVFGLGGVVTGGYVLGDTNLVFPFGFHPRLIARHSWQYLVQLSGFVSGVGIVGLVYALLKKRTLYTKIFVLTAWYPIALYGSWLFSDNPTVGLVTIGNSYMRYWLPVFVFLIPFAAYLLVQLFEHYKKVDQRYAAGIWIGFFVLWLAQGTTLFYFGADGFASVKAQNTFASAVKVDVLDRVDSQSLIITDKWDKVFWPDRAVGRNIFSVSTQEAIHKWHYMQSENGVDVPMYYFGLTFSEKERMTLGDAGIELQEIQVYPNNHVLYITQSQGVNELSE